jgi:dihydrofolate reductase
VDSACIGLTSSGSCHVRVRLYSAGGPAPTARRRGLIPSATACQFRDMLIFSMSVSTDGFINDRDGGFDWAAPDDELIQFHHDEVASLDGYLLGRRLYETMRVWDTDPSMRETESGAAFADVWAALPKVVFSRTLSSVAGNARLADRPLSEEIAAVDSADTVVSIGGAVLAGQAVELGLVDELRIYRCPVVVGGGTPHLPPVARDIRLELLETREFDSHVVYERYRRAS